MKLACHGCCFRIEVELFLPVVPLRKYDVLPREEIFNIERRLLRKLRQKMREAETVETLER